MKSILELRRERESLTPIRKMINLLSHLYSDGIDSSTPVKLVEEIVGNLNIDWSNPELKILDVKSNRATFSLIIIEKLLEHGHHIDHILDNMIYAIDGDKIQSMTSNKAFLNAFKRGGNIYHEDFLTYDFKMKFDLVVGNPPFSKTEGRSLLYPKFFSKSLEISDKVVMIMPVRLNANGPKLKTHNLLLKKHLIHLSENISHHFPSVDVSNMHCVTASRFVENELTSDSDDILYPERSRIRAYRGLSTIRNRKNNDEFGIQCVHAIQKGGPVWRGIKRSVIESSKTSNISEPWLVLLAYTVSNGKVNTMIVKNSKDLKWSDGVFAIPVDSEQEAVNLVQWLNSNEMINLIKEYQIRDSVYWLSQKFLDTLPWYK